MKTAMCQITYTRVEISSRHDKTKKVRESEDTVQTGQSERHRKTK